MGIQVFNKASLLLFILTFWSIVYAMFVLIGQSLIVPNELGQLSSVSGTDLLFNVMLFKVPASYEIPMIVSLFLDIIAIMSLYVIYTIIAGVVRGYNID